MGKRKRKIADEGLGKLAVEKVRASLDTDFYIRHGRKSEKEEVNGHREYVLDGVLDL